VTERNANQKKERSKMQTFLVPFSLEEINEDITIVTNNSNKLSKEQLINKAFKLHSKGNISEAAKYYQNFIDQGFKDAKVFSNYGVILSDLGKLVEAEILERKAIHLNPNYSKAHSNLGNILKDLGKLEEAEISQSKAIELNPDFPEAHYNLGNILNSLGKLKDAEIAYLKAIELKSDFLEAHSNLGNLLRDLGKLEEAEISQRKTIELKPDSSEAYANLGNVLRDSGKLRQSLKAYQKSLEIDPNQIHHISHIIYILSRLCMWNEIEEYSPYLNKIGIEGNAVGPLTLMYIEDNPLNHLKRAINFSKEKRRCELPYINCDKKNKINIGYFSSDFKDHPITHLLIRTLELHDKSKFQIYAYSLSKVEDHYTKRVKDAVSVFRDLSNLSDLDIVKIARNDQIDIAIDLNGYTKNNRISIFLYRVSPVQINYLGYTGSLGSNSFDYILADRVLIPEENKKFYNERVLYLPNSFLPHDNTREILENKFTREELGLPTEGFVFTCFNAIQKITRREFKIWIRLLKRVEKSVLWLLKPNKTAINNLYSELSDFGINKERIIFADHMNLEDHLSRLSCADLFLDTFNFNAGATANFALSANLPLITLLGKSYSARMAASILIACNLNELVTTNYSEYEALAYELATNNEKLRQIRSKLKNKDQLPFFDSARFTNELEVIYTKIINK
tara:strand:+ start:1594 stop:3633 length:2040 start_codon:yes stop_codon:yes gene_type:complete